LVASGARVAEHVQMKCRAAIVSLGTSVRWMSSVIVPTGTMILLGRSTVLAVSFTIRDSGKGARFGKGGGGEPC
jgi:hypothetical protein